MEYVEGSSVTGIYSTPITLHTDTSLFVEESWMHVHVNVYHDKITVIINDDTDNILSFNNVPIQRHTYGKMGLYGGNGRVHVANVAFTLGSTPS